MIDKKVSVITVTYNRKEYLVGLLNNLSQQTKRIESILILDNFSSDGTEKELKNIGFTESTEVCKLHRCIWNNMNCYYYRNNENTGGSGGFSKAFELIQEIESDFVWVMDDDVSPEKDCLEKLLSFMTEDVKICIPNRTGNGFQDHAIVKYNLVNPFKYGTKAKTYVTDFSNKDRIEVVDMPFEGPLISMDVIKEVGLPNKEYFILYDDTDYAFRALKFTKINFIPSAILKKMIIPTRDRNKLMGWKDYYSYRNCIIFTKKYSTNLFVKLFIPFIMWLDLSLRALYRRKFYNFKVINKAIIDGCRNRNGKTINPGDL